MSTVAVGVVGAGAFGSHHVRVLRELPGVHIAGVVDTNSDSLSRFSDLPTFSDARALIGLANAAVVAVPTGAHASVTCSLLEAGIDVLVEKPIASDLASARLITETALRRGRVLQVGHLERFNPAVVALKTALTLPLFFEIHRMSMPSLRSLDVDVVLDLMIHDVDILLSLTRALPEEIRAAGIRILSERVDIANVRLAFPNGCIANLTASRVSTEKIRKLRLFQPGEYLSLDYTRQDVSRVAVRDGEVSFGSLPVQQEEPLRAELRAFIDSVRSREAPAAGGEEAVAALQVCLTILDKIEEHGQLVQQTLAAHPATLQHSVPS